ncbi:MAG TPA: 50S ribosomal protein L15 [Candidatus Saccharimonadales bacterium]|nr:50S ribosomal protein L15 [Candidatus Saccharimonadales bacterium]
MKFNELETSSNKDKKRVGRGISAGQGKTAGRGTKGQKARTGKKIRATFMGGQGPLVRRIPKKRGFKSLRVPAQVVYTDQLEALAGKTADNKTLAEAGLITTPYHTVKVITRGELTGKVDVKVQAASKGAQEVIAKAGGSFAKTDVPTLPPSQRKKSQTEEE